MDFTSSAASLSRLLEGFFGSSDMANSELSLPAGTDLRACCAARLPLLTIRPRGDDRRLVLGHHVLAGPVGVLAAVSLYRR